MIKNIFWKIISVFAPAGDPAPVILMYHSIGHNRAQFTVTPEEFEKQMSFLKSSGRECLRLSEFASRLRSGTLPVNAVAVTFDDGYEDNFNEALPILKKHSTPATIFISTAYIGKEFTLKKGDLPATASADAVNLNAGSSTPIVASSLSVMDIDQIRELSNGGLVEIMPHGHSHGILRDMNREDALKDISQSKQMIEGITGKPVVCFAYPYGKYSNETIEIVSSLRFQSAVTVKEKIIEPQSNGSQVNPLELPRMAISATTSMAEFKCKVAKSRRYLAIKRLLRRKK